MQRDSPDALLERCYCAAPSKWTFSCLLGDEPLIVELANNLCDQSMCKRRGRRVKSSLRKAVKSNASNSRYFTTNRSELGGVSMHIHYPGKRQRLRRLAKPGAAPGGQSSLRRGAARARGRRASLPVRQLRQGAGEGVFKPLVCALL